MTYGCIRRLIEGAPAGRAFQDYKQSLPFDPETDPYYYWENFLIMSVFGDPSLSIYSCRHSTIRKLESDQTTCTITLTWDSLPNANYTIEACTNLVQGVWSCATNVTSTGGVMRVVLNEPTAKVKMYRILGEIDY